MEHNMNLSLTDGAANGAESGAERGAVPAGVAAVAPCAPCPPVKPGGHGEHLARSSAAARARRPGHSAPRGAPDGANGYTPNGAQRGAVRIDAETIMHRLEDAGRTLLSLPEGGHSTKLRTSRLDIVRTALESYGWESGRLRPAVPDAARITRMDEALGWIALIPQDRYVLRRIVGARALISPTTERHLFTWRRLAALLGADHKAVQRWHAQGIDLIVTALNRKQAV